MPRTTKARGLTDLSLAEAMAVLRKLQGHGVTVAQLRRLRQDSDLARNVAALLRGAAVVEGSDPGEATFEEEETRLPGRLPS